MNKKLNRAILTLLGIAPLAGLPTQALAKGTTDISASVNDSAGYTLGAMPAYLWDGGNIGYNAAGVGDCTTNDCGNLPAAGHERIGGAGAMSGSVQSDRNLGWNHTATWLVFEIKTAGGYTISWDRVSTNTNNQPAFSVWTSGASRYLNENQGHKFNQVIAPISVTPDLLNSNGGHNDNGNDYMLPSDAGGNASGYITGFVGYANSGAAYTNANGNTVLGALTKGTSTEGTVVTSGPLAGKYTSVVTKGNFNNAHAGSISAPYTGQGSSVITADPRLANDQGGGHAELKLWLPAGWYAMVGGGSCADFTCTPTSITSSQYAIKILSDTTIKAPDASPSPSPSASPTSAPSATPTPSGVPTPTPTPSGVPTPTPTPTTKPTLPANIDCSKKPAPVLDSVAPSFDATVGKELSFTVTAVDYCDEAITVKSLPKLRGVNLSQDFDANNKWAATFKWTPSANQANKKFTVTFAAIQTEKPGKTSPKQKTFIRVWPAGMTAENGSVQKISINRAQWSAAKSELLLTGKTEISKLLSPAERATVLAEKLQITDSKGAVIGQGQVKPSGNWSARIGGLSESAVPCIVEASFAGQSVHRDVKKAPAHCGN